MKLSIADTAHVKVIRAHELEVGDMILYAEHCAKVIEIKQGWLHETKNEFAVLQVYPEDESLTITVARHRAFYKIIDCETKLDTSLIMPKEEAEITSKMLEEEYCA